MRINEILTGFALASVVAVCGAATFLLIDADIAVKSAKPAISAQNDKLGKILDKLSDVAGNLNTAVEEVNRPCRGSGNDLQACGTLADVAKTLGTTRKTIGLVEKAAIHENTRLGVLDGQEATLFADTHAALGKLGDDLDAAKTTITKMQPIEDESAKVLASTNTEVQGLTAQNADIHRFLAASAEAMKNTAGITLDGNKVADHLEQEIDHPAKQKWYIQILPTSIRALITAGQVYSAVK